jgi:hypothetical protein
MGVFSELQIDPPLYCPYCGEIHKIAQTYDVGYCEYYKIGDKTPIKTMGKLIMKDNLICDGENHRLNRTKVLCGNESPMFCFYCFEDGRYLGTVLNIEDALAILNFPRREEYMLELVY